CLQALIGVRADGDDGDDARALVSALARKHMPEQVKKLSGFLLALLSEKLFPLIDRNYERRRLVARADACRCELPKFPEQPIETCRRSEFVSNRSTASRHAVLAPDSLQACRHARCTGDDCLLGADHGQGQEMLVVAQETRQETRAKE